MQYHDTCTANILIYEIGLTTKSTIFQLCTIEREGSGGGGGGKMKWDC